MSARRALFPESELRRWARVAREEGVAIRGQIGPDGSRSILIGPRPEVRDDNADDLDDRLAKFAS